jgi:guanylate kinase
MSTKGNKGKLVIISGPSGAGKSTICRRVVECLDACLSVSATTRPKGAAEIEGKDYYFLSPQEFKRQLDEGLFLEHADVFGNWYGTPRKPVENALAEGRIVILEIDVQGGLQVKAEIPDAVMIFILPPRLEELLKRIDARRRGEDDAARQKRLAKAEAEIAVGKENYKYFVVNDVLDKAVQDVIDIIHGHEKR